MPFRWDGQAPVTETSRVSQSGTCQALHQCASEGRGRTTGSGCVADHLVGEQENDCDGGRYHHRKTGKDQAAGQGGNTNRQDEQLGHQGRSPGPPVAAVKEDGYGEQPGGKGQEEAQGEDGPPEGENGAAGEQLVAVPPRRRQQGNCFGAGNERHHRCRDRCRRGLFTGRKAGSPAGLVRRRWGTCWVYRGS